MLEVGVGLSELGDRHIDATVQGIPVARQFNQIKERAAPFARDGFVVFVNLPQFPHH